MAVEKILRNYGARQRLGEVSLEYDLHVNGMSSLSCVPGYGVRMAIIRSESACLVPRTITASR